jgi:hypothetical protein
MVQIDIPIAFAVGQMLADAANQQLRTTRPAPYFRALAYTNMFTGLFFAPIPMYFLIDYFGWETTYMCDPLGLTRFFIPIVLFALMLAANLGFWLSKALIRKGRDWIGRVIYVLIWIYSLAWIVGNWPRSTRLGTYAQYQAARDSMVRVWEVSKDPFLVILIATLIIFFVPLALFIWSLRRPLANEVGAMRS